MGTRNPHWNCCICFILITSKMIIGNGDIAKVLNNRDGALFFASGVSDSSCKDMKQFNREADLLLSFRSDLCCFYFSSIGVFTNESIYYRHKKAMEYLVSEHFDNYNIIRIGNIDWGNNPKTFLNFLKNKKKAGESFKVLDEMKYMISQKELLLLTDNLPLTGQNEINAFGKMALVKDLI
jgi:UDP-2-acetamido-2,6-beta-L-arabino-hexul-4-ose reductase